MKDAIAEAKKLAGLKADADVDLLMLPQSKSFFEQFLGGDGPELDDFTAILPRELKSLGNLKAWKQLLGSKVLMWMPYHIELK